MAVADRPDLGALRPAVLAVLNVDSRSLLMEYDDDHPECVVMLVLEDVGPAKMGLVVRLLRAQPGKLRLYARVVERAYWRAFQGLPFKRARALAEDLSVATVRSE